MAVPEISTIPRLEVASDAERRAFVRDALKGCMPRPDRPFTDDVSTAVRQLVVAEVVEGYRAICRGGKTQGTPKLRPLRNFYESVHPAGQQFYLLYTQEWKTLKKMGAVPYLASKDRIGDFVRTVAMGRPTASPAAMATLITPQPRAKSRVELLPLSPTLSIRLYVCGAFEPTAQARDMIAEGMRWFVDQGFPVFSVALRLRPGGAHHQDFKVHPPCGDKRFQNFQKGEMYVEVGLYPERTPCTLRHEGLHDKYHDLEKNNPEVVAHVKALYAWAMVNAGLFADDEFFMEAFIHAGHAMRDDNEFFASFSHAYSHHADLYVKYVNDPKTKDVTRAYAIAMWRLLRDEVFHGKVFTDKDPWEKP